MPLKVSISLFMVFCAILDSKIVKFDKITVLISVGGRMISIIYTNIRFKGRHFRVEGKHIKAQFSRVTNSLLF